MIKTAPVNTIIIQVYFPSNSDEEEIEKIYNLEKLIAHTHDKNKLIIMGNFNAMVGNEADNNIKKNYGLRTRKERGSSLVRFCKQNNI